MGFLWVGCVFGGGDWGGVCVWGVGSFYYLITVLLLKKCVLERSIPDLETGLFPVLLPFRHVFLGLTCFGVGAW